VRIGKGGVSGVIDRLYRNAEGWHVLDYKTDKIKEEEAPRRCQRYRPQMLMYSLAAAKLLGCEPPDVYIYFARLGKPLRLGVSTDDAEAFERRAARAVDDILAGRFDPVTDCPQDCEFRGSAYCETTPIEGGGKS